MCGNLSMDEPPAQGAEFKANEANSSPAVDAGAESQSLWRTRSTATTTGLEAAAPAANPVRMREELPKAWLIRDQALQCLRQTLNDFKQGELIELGMLRSVIDSVLASVQRQPAALINLARIKSEGDCLYAHAVAVGVLMVALAHHLGWEEEACRDCGLAGMLQDLGMSELPPEMLDQPAHLSPAQFRQVREHVGRGHLLLLRSGMEEGLWMQAALQHHERCDGSGYPGGLLAEQIAPVARMGAICDVYDALTSERAHRPAWTPVQALAAMAAARGQFDRSLLAAFIKLVGVYPVGTLVRLASQRLALVIESRPEAPRQPLLQPFFSLRTGSRTLEDRIDLMREPNAERILQVENPKTWGFRDLDALWLGRAA